jgi:hypothetical protein
MDYDSLTQDTWQEWLMVGGYLAFLLIAMWGVFIKKSGDS